MTVLFLFLTGLISGTFGALLGLGGGAIVIPVLTILFHLPIHTAIGISLVGVIATSTGAAIVYVREGKANIRLGMTLELGTTVGAVLGAVIAGLISAKVLYILFAAMLAYNTYSMYGRNEKAEAEVAAGSQIFLPGNDNPGIHSYKVKNIPLGLFFSTLAGIMSGLLGVGGGLIKIPVMYLFMGIPLKVAAATSNFMIGVTATASASIYYLSGKIDVATAVPVALGVFAGAFIGTRMNTRISTRLLKKIFVLVFAVVAVQMALKGLGR
ncbi:MAG: sulfite exporter TauE/SafE family protein [Firmicutes bacterium]|nr:sulfite exporter TauE/SafE family protein [Bacillota bacterium]